MKLKKISTPLVIIISITVTGILIVLLFDWLIYKEYVENGNLLNLNNLFSSLSFILSIVTIYLLYINYKHQEKEFREMNKINSDSNNELIRGNELILLNNQLEYLTSELKEKNFEAHIRYLKGSIDFHHFYEMIIYDSDNTIEERVKVNFIISHLDKLIILVGLIINTDELLYDLIRKSNHREILINRLPTHLIKFNDILENLIRKNGNLSSTKGLELLSLTRDLKWIYENAHKIQ